MLSQNLVVAWFEIGKKYPANMSRDVPQNSEDACKYERLCPKKDVDRCVWRDVLAGFRSDSQT